MTIFIAQYFSSLLPKNTTVGEIVRTSASKYSYCLNLPYGKQKVSYRLVIGDMGNGKYGIEDGGFDKMGVGNYLAFTGDSKVVEGLDVLIRKILGEQVGNGKVVKVEVDEPRWRFTYNLGQSNVIIEFVFDVFMKRVNVLNVNKSAIASNGNTQTIVVAPIIDKQSIPVAPVQPVTIIHQQTAPTTTITSTTTGSSSSSSSSQYSSAPFTALSAKDDQLILKLANIALDKIIPDI